MIRLRSVSPFRRASERHCCNAEDEVLIMALRLFGTAWILPNMLRNAVKSRAMNLDLNLLAIYARVVEAGSFAEAAWRRASPVQPPARPSPNWEK